MGVDTVGLSGIVDDLGSGFTIERFVGHTDKVTVFDVIGVGRIAIGFRDISVVAGILGMEEVVDVGDGHGGVVAHDVISDDVAGVKASRASSRNRSSIGIKNGKQSHYRE